MLAFTNKKHAELTFYTLIYGYKNKMEIKTLQDHKNNDHTHSLYSMTSLPFFPSL